MIRKQCVCVKLKIIMHKWATKNKENDGSEGTDALINWQKSKHKSFCLPFNILRDLEENLSKQSFEIVLAIKGGAKELTTITESSQN